MVDCYFFGPSGMQRPRAPCAQVLQAFKGASLPLLSPVIAARGTDRSWRGQSGAYGRRADRDAGLRPDYAALRHRAADGIEMCRCAVFTSIASGASDLPGLFTTIAFCVSCRSSCSGCRGKVFRPPSFFSPTRTAADTSVHNSRQPRLGRAVRCVDAALCRTVWHLTDSCRHPRAPGRGTHARWRARSAETPPPVRRTR